MRYLRHVLLLALLTGCSHDSTAPATIDGAYPLRRYRDLPLPAVVSEEPSHLVEITAGAITLHGDLTFTDSYSFDRNDNGVLTTVVVACTGYWTPTETSPQGGQLITLVETPVPSGCGDRGTAEWDHDKSLTIAWNALGLTQHRR
ncbi:MAG: hypothetical protein ACJ79K_13115 [Gemmatimonadaceae bacterium]